ncbi:unnamed protein product, partial [Timema podura]|nr:unnamed protein product [Timema podura]
MWSNVVPRPKRPKSFKSGQRRQEGTNIIMDKQEKHVDDREDRITKLNITARAEPKRNVGPKALHIAVFVKHWYNLTAGVLRVHVPQITGLQWFTETLPSQGVKPREKQLGQEGSTLLRARENISELNELFPPAEDSCPWKLVTPKPGK